MRKTMSVLLIAAILLGVSFVSAYSGEFDLKNLKPRTLVFATMGTGSQFYAQANAMNSVFIRYLPKGAQIDIQTTSAGTVSGFLLVGVGRADISISTPINCVEGMATGLMGNPPMKNVRALVGGLEDSCCFIVFTREFVNKTGFTTFDEVVKAKYPIHLATKALGSIGEMTAFNVLKSYGVTYDDIKAWGGSVTHTDSSNVIDMLRDNRANVSIEGTSQTQANWMELTMTADVHYAPFNEKTIRDMKAIGYIDTVIPAGAYNGKVTKDYPSLAAPGCLVVDEKLPDEYAYLLTKAMCENKDALVAAFSGFRPFDPKTAGLPYKLGAPIHPGAKRYFDEVGYPTK